MADQQEPDIVREPQRLRALAHPLRWKLIDVLTSEGSATATQCAETLGESVASCSYHLNMLAKYGFVAVAPGAGGRQKPWKLVNPEQSIRLRGLDEDSALAGEAAVETFLDHETALMKTRLRSYTLEPDEWQQATGFTSSTTFLTAEETGELRDQIQALFDRYQERLTDRSLRPEGAREVRLFASNMVAPDRTRAE